MKLANKVALITGAGSGFGRASALLFAREGAKVAVVDVKEKSGRETVDLIQEKKGQAYAIPADVSKAEDAEKMIKITLKEYGKIDILFNNAGVAMPAIPIEEIQEELYDRIMNVNAKGIFLGCKFAVPVMKKQGGGVIINTASISGVRPRPGYSPYSASKGAAILLTKGLAVELAAYKIRVNCINPVAAETAMLPVILGQGEIEKRKNALVSSIPWGRLAQADDVAYAALYLASEESSMVTGICLDVDGGRAI